MAARWPTRSPCLHVRFPGKRRAGRDSTGLTNRRSDGFPLGATKLREARHELLHSFVGERDSHLFIVVPRDARDDHALAEDRVAHLVPGAEPRFGRSSGPCPRRTTGPGRRKTGEHLVAPRLFPLLVSHPVALPIELGPRVALFGLDLAAQLDPLARKLHEKPRRRIHVRAAEERSAASVREVRAIFGPGDAHVAEATLLFELGLAAALDRARVGKDTFLHTGHENDRELQTLYRMHRDERRRRLRVLVFVDVRHERDLLEKARQLLLLWKAGELFGQRTQLLDVRPALLPFFGPVLEVCLVPRESGNLVEQPRQRELLGRAAKLRHDPSEGDERVLLPFGDRRDDVRLRERVTDAHLVLACGREQRGARLVAQAARRRVQDAREREGVVRIPDQPQVGQRVLHLAALIERHPADDLIRESERAELVLDRARLRVRPVQNGDVPRPVRLAFTLKSLDLSRDDLGFMRLVVRLHHDDGSTTLPVGPQLLLFARGVVPHHRVRRVEDPLRRAIVLLELDDLGVRIVAFEIEDVPHVGAAPAEDRLIVVADDGQVLLEAGEVSQEHVLGAVGVLVLVEEDVLVAVLPLLERAVARLEQAAGEEQQVVEVDCVVLTQKLVVALPDDGGDAVQLSLRARGQIRRSFELVLRAGDDRGDGAGVEDALARVRVGHRLTEDGALVSLVVDGERTIDPDRRTLAAEEARTEGVKSPDGELSEALFPYEAVEPLPHFPSRLVGESDGQDRTRGHPEISDQVRDPVRQDPGLAGSGAGEDQQRAIAVGHGGALLRI